MLNPLCEGSNKVTLLRDALIRYAELVSGPILTILSGSVIGHDVTNPH